MTMPNQPTEPTVLKFRSASGRTEIAWRPDGTVSLHVRHGHDTLTGADLIAAARALDKGQDAAYAAGKAEGLRQATEAVRAQANLPDLVHFDRPSDFRKGVLTCLAALEAGASDAH